MTAVHDLVSEDLRAIVFAARLLHRLHRLLLSLTCTRRSLREDSIVVGFSFSFPIKQGSIASGTLIEQGKGFANPGAIGSDPVALLTAAFRRQVLQGPTASSRNRAG